MRITKKAETKNQKIILEYLDQNASDVLVEKINTGKKTLAGCWNFITGEARKRAEAGCACIEDKEVFGWAVHYFEEDGIKETKNSGAVKALFDKIDERSKKPEQKKKPEPAKKKTVKTEEQYGQLSLFDF